MDANNAEGTPSAAKSQFEREKWQKESEFQREQWLKENEFRERDLKAKERELSIKEGELGVRRDETKRTLFSNPLTLALLAATVAAVANVWVAYHNGAAQRELETVRADKDQALERQKAQDARIVSAINGDPNIASARLRFLAETHLITDDTLRTFILKYIQTQTVNVPPTTVNSTTPPSAPVKRVVVDSGWLEGGHSQSEVCGGLVDGVKAQNPGKSVNIVNMSEDSRKDFLGHVTYKYHCEFAIN